MKINVNFIHIDKEEEVSFSIHKMTSQITSIMEMLSDTNVAHGGKLSSYLLGKIENTFYKVDIKDIYYLESVDRKIYFYTEKKSYELNEKLYILEEMLSDVGFARISKSMLLNTNKIYSFVPTFSGNLEAALMNKEKVIISRRYVANIKKQLGMGEVSHEL
jgi:DNA-binding LytR/AlgR family response regulator